MQTSDHRTDITTAPPQPQAELDFGYDPNPVHPGEPGAGLFSCSNCGQYACNCPLPPICYSNEPTYKAHGCNLAGCILHPNG